ncbi:MAG: hypothetical protein WCF33_04540 [Pseudonocardiaceae bacterium]
MSQKLRCPSRSLRVVAQLDDDGQTITSTCTKQSGAVEEVAAQPAPAGIDGARAGTLNDYCEITIEMMAGPAKWQRPTLRGTTEAFASR